MSGTDAEQRLSTRRLNDMGLGFMQAGTLLGAIDLGLFDALGDGPLAPAEVATKLGLDEERTEKLITACAALELVERRGERIANAPDVDRFLVRGKPTYFGDYLVHFGLGSFSGWSRLGEQLRSSAAPTRRYYDLTADAAQARALTESGYTGSQGTARRMARRFDFSRYHQLLDLGGGSGVYSIEACRANPSLRASVFDAANVCTVTREFIEKAGLSDRIEAIAGDFTSDPLPAGADVVLLCGNLHAYDSETARRVIRKAYDVLPSGGGMILCDYMIDADRAGPPVSAFLSISLEFGGGSGKVHDANEFRAYLEEAGFRVERVDEFVEGSLGWATATRP
jgi:SAM-dependent methyltransferase